MSDPSFKYEKLGKILQKLPKETPAGDFDQKFWKRFELEKDLPGPAGADSPARVRRWALSATAVACLAFFFTARNTVVDKPSVEIAQGEAYVRSSDGAPDAPLLARHRFAKGQGLKTGEAGWVLLELENGYRIKLNPDSEILVKKLKPKFLPGKTVLYLKQGEMLVSIGGPNHVRYPLEIITPNAFARALGTQFMVRAPSAADPVSRVSVLCGTVQVGRLAGPKPAQEKPLSVTAGRETSVSETAQELTVREMMERTRRELEELFQFGRKNRAILLIGMSPARFRELLRPCVLYIRIQSDDENVQSIAAIARDIEEAVKSEDKKGHLSAVEALEDAVEKQNELDPVPLLLFTGAYYAFLGEDMEAARIFELVYLKYPLSRFASLAMRAEAHIQSEKLGNAQKAEALIREIRSRYPDSYESEASSRPLS